MLGCLGEGVDDVLDLRVIGRNAKAAMSICIMGQVVSG